MREILRLSEAITAGAFTHPLKNLTIIAPPAKILSLPADTYDFVTSDKGRYDALRRANKKVDFQFPERIENALIFATRSKTETLSHIGEALARIAQGGLILLDGQKKDSIETLHKNLKSLNIKIECYIKSHGRLIWFHAPEAPDHAQKWRFEGQEKRQEMGFVTQPGVFSERKIDAGSDFLIKTLKKTSYINVLRGVSADFGAGWGYISWHILKQCPDIEALHLIEINKKALNAAKANINDPRAVFDWRDLRDDPAQRFDFIIMNPPFHQTRSPDPELGRLFISRARLGLRPEGVLFMVANRHLPYEQDLDRAFKNWKILAQNNQYKIFEARKPV